MSPRGRAALTAGAVAYVAQRALGRAVGGTSRWTRTNFRGRTVQLSGGPAVAAGAIVAAGMTPGGSGAVIAGGAAAVVGLYDDLYGDAHARGLRGHFAALRQRRLTTGMVKLAGLAAAGLGAGWLQRGRSPATACDAALVAGTANLVNLLDLRPGRALKAAGAVAVLSAAGNRDAAGVVATATAAAAAAVLPADLGERVMIGDCGANAVGALVGWSLANGLGRKGRAAALTVVVGLTLVSERVSFTAVIERTPWLRAWDGWGRR